MSISEKDIKKLWGLAAGLCAFPGCAQDCLLFVDLDDPTVIGEMAHVISQSPVGPRGVPRGGANDYGNLILLCPTHHTLIDKAKEGSFPANMLLGWKADHEKRVRDRLSAPSYDSRAALATSLLRLMAQNYATWKTYGPESEAATLNPVSNVAALWELRKLSVIVPNNRRIVAALEAHQHFFSPSEYAVIATFIEHAAGFEESAYNRRENVPRFPQPFMELMNRASAE